MKRIVRFLILLGLLVLGYGLSGPAVYAQAAPTVTEESTDSLGVVTYKITFPDGRPDQYAVGADQLRDSMQAYAASAYPGLNTPTTPTPTPLPSWNGIVDGLDKEIESIIKEEIQTIMSGLQSKIISIVANLVDASPIGEVESLKDLLKEAYGKQQKMDYQDYKVKYAEMKSQTELSTGFVNYYNALDLKKIIETFGQRVDDVRKLAHTNVLSADQQMVADAYLNKLGNTSAMVEDVKSACNLNQGTVYMAEADRVKVLEVSRKELVTRFNELMKLRSFLSQVYATRVGAYNKQQQLRGIYNQGTTLNRTAATGTIKLTP